MGCYLCRHLIYLYGRYRLCDCPATETPIAIVYSSYLALCNTTFWLVEYDFNNAIRSFGANR